MKVLVLRFSAIGDVSLILPAVIKVLELNPGLEITLVSKPFLEPLFKNISGLKFFAVDTKKIKGLPGLFALSSEIFNKVQPDSYLDLHDNIRSRIIGLFMWVRGVKIVVIDKGRAEKKELTRRKHKLLRPLKHTVTRYLEVFARAGFITPEYEGDTAIDSGRENAHLLPRSITPWASHEGLIIGFAPFAGMPLKELPSAQNLALLVALFKKYPTLKLVLFFGKDQGERILLLLDLLSEVYILKPGQFIQTAAELVSGLEVEIILMNSLDLMISMDSANLHLAALCGIPVLGIFGTTHPYLGFAPYGQEHTGSFGHEGLNCRPCTVYGKGTCYRGDFACMTQLKIEDIMERISMQLEKT